MKQLPNIVSSLDSLTVEDEEVFKKSIEAINQDMEKYASQFMKDIKNLKKIAWLKYGESLSINMTYVGIAVKALVMVALAWQQTLEKAADIAGPIFRPVNSALGAIAKLLNLITRLAELAMIQSDINNIPLTEALRKEELEEAKALLLKSTFLKVTSFLLTVFTVIAFTGALTTPLGWVFLAGASVVDWLDNGVQEVRKAEKELRRCKRKYGQATEEEKELIEEELSALEKKVTHLKTEEFWLRFNVVSMILFACAPIPVVGLPMLGLGFVVLGIAGARSAYVAAKEQAELFLEAQSKLPPVSETEAADKTIRAQLARGMQNTMLKLAKSLVKPKPVIEIELMPITKKVNPASSPVEQTPAAQAPKMPPVEETRTTTSKLLVGESLAAKEPDPVMQIPVAPTTKKLFIETHKTKKLLQSLLEEPVAETKDMKKEHDKLASSRQKSRNKTSSMPSWLFDKHAPSHKNAEPSDPLTHSVNKVGKK
jgi:hypothetical protein